MDPKLQVFLMLKLAKSSCSGSQQYGTSLASPVRVDSLSDVAEMQVASVTRSEAAPTRLPIRSLS